MFDNDNEDERIFLVVQNDEEQYSIWWHDRPLPPGWYDVGLAGTKATCLAHVEKIWTDMRPKSVREQMAKQMAEQTGRAATPTDAIG